MVATVPMGEANGRAARNRKCRPGVDGPPLGLLNRWIGIVRSRSGGFSKKIKRWGGLALGGISRPRHQAGAAAPEPDWHQCHGGGRRGGARPRARRSRTRGTWIRHRFLREEPWRALVRASVRWADGYHLAAASVGFLVSTAQVPLPRRTKLHGGPERANTAMAQVPDPP